MASPTTTPEPIAVIGSSCRFPGGASTPSKLWDLLKAPRDLLSDVPADRFNAAAFYHPDGEHHGTTNVSQSYFMDEDVRVFDYKFFNINPREAEATDPQQRLLLETVYEGIEAAGYSMPRLRGTDTAVFVGQTTDDYSTLQYRDIDTIPNYFATGVSRAIMANRVSNFFDWKGASVCLDTACSSSLVAVHLAIQELRTGASSMAVAAGVNLIFGPEVYIFESNIHMLSPTGRSRMWDAGADGYARGEGFASVFLKTLSRAVADGDHIECVIRETGLNQDGYTPGLTMPSPASQASLIRATYARAGLDLARKDDRPQYFEAHGTGTLVGDPVEAEAVYKAFFAQGSEPNDDPLYVGSIKTIFGHLESTAGLAGLLKASLAVQQGVIPPNMHFHTLNPKIRPFYDSLCVPTTARPWPALPPGVPRRASLNNFGFGGTNAHAIIESWEPATEAVDVTAVEAESIPYGPFVLSANSTPALIAYAEALRDHIDSHEDLSLPDLAWTLQMRRTPFGHRAYATGTDRAALLASLAAGIATARKNPAAFVTDALPVPRALPPRILGVFTGQGAQWPAMGAGLYVHSALFRATLQALEASLASLPEADRPAWSLTAELCKQAAASRIQEAALSQPLCTALQIALVDLLRAAGVTFAGVVGHSSGEIAAAYAVGYLTAADAVRIAYYRGVHAARARDGPVAGSMMAVGMGFDEAVAFCAAAPYRGRIVAAASNARSSTTLSGDADALAAAKAQLDRDGVFARVLKVDTAYHSHHMERCSAPYRQSLQACAIDVRAPPVCPDDGFVWFSSVHGTDGRSIYEPDALRAEYWVQNMAQPVLFAQALERAITESPCFDMVLEVGPHPALKGPASEVLRTLTSVDLPYAGLLARGSDDVSAFSRALGFVWSHFQATDSHAPPLVDFEAFRRACVGGDEASSSSSFQQQPRLLKNLPPYRWDHDVPLWRESMVSRKFRLRTEPMHPLLGTVTSAGNKHEMRWRNVMKINELAWLRGHEFQNQTLFPAAGYVSMAVDASVKLVASTSSPEDDASDPLTAQIVELQDLQILTAITLDPESAGTEVIFVIRVVDRAGDRVTAAFSCYSASADGTTRDAEKVNFTGRAVITVGRAAATPDTARALLPPRTPPTLPMSEVDLARFYRELEKIGLRYTGDFVVASAVRRLNLATAVIKRPDHNAALLVHPATLDAAFHGLLAAYSFPGDGRMWTSYLPTGIRTVRVNIAAASQAVRRGSTHVVADCFLRDATSKVIAGDLSLFRADDDRVCEIQITRLACSSFTKPQPQNDRRIFSHTVWRPDVAAGIRPEEQPQPEKDMFATIDILDRVSVYYLRKLVQDITPQEAAAAEWHFQSMLHWARDYLLPKIDQGKHRRLSAATAADTPAMVQAWEHKYASLVDMEIVASIGRGLPAMVRGQLPTLQVLMENDRLNRLYKEGVGIDWAYAQFRLLVEQMAHRHPRLRVLEIGAGTGGASVTAIKAVAPHFASYTYTDISPAFFEKAKTLFTPEEQAKMDFRVLDIEQDPVAQGFEEEGFDLILASNVLHATKYLSKTLAHCRRLTRPGGRMVMIEVTGDAIFTSFSMSGLPGWWLGKDDGRVYGPLVNEARWDALLQDAGFSGVDVSGGDLEDYYCLVMSTQAVDDRVALLREPLSPAHRARPANQAAVSQVRDVVVVGGKTVAVCRSTQIVRRLLQPLGLTVTLVPGVEDLADRALPPQAAILSMADLDEPMFQHMTDAKFRGMQNMVLGSSALLWVTRNRRTDEPYSNMAVGMARAIAFESPHLFLQFLDLDHFRGGLGSVATAEATVLAETLMQLIYLGDASFAADRGLLWTREQELSIEDGRLLIPRILYDDALNDRLNADRRPITRQINLAAHGDDGSVAVVQDAGQLQLLETDLFPSVAEATKKNAQEQHSIKLLASSMHPLRTRNHQTVFLGVGKDLDATAAAAAAAADDDDDAHVLVLCAENSSVVRVATDRMVPLPRHVGDDKTAALLLQDLLLDVLAESLVYEVEGALWVHGSDTSLAARLAHKTAAASVPLIATTSTEAASPLLVYVHPRDTERSVLNLLPTKGPVTFTNAGPAPEPETIRRILAAGDADTAIEARPLFRTVQSRKAVVLNQSFAELQQLVQKYASSESSAATTTTVDASQVTSVDKAAGLALDSLAAAHVLSWTAPAPVTALVVPTTSVPLLRSDRTYFLVGLTGELGLSLCGWMADHGARHIALASRTPQIRPEMLADLARRGATDVRVYALDVSDRAALHAVHAQITAAMPPIAGVANAAMVLHDKPFDNYTLDEFACVLGPKVDGSRHLDALFSTAGELDFFVLFSSLSCVIGNKGQSNYSAANMFMHTLAVQRRRRGLPASIMDIAMLLGVGYVARALDQFEARLVGQYGYIGLSEPEMHAMFASAILAGHPDSAVGRHHGPEIITGLPADGGTRFPHKPLFAHNIQEVGETVSETADDNTELSTRVLHQLAAAAAAAGSGSGSGGRGTGDGGEGMLAVLEAAFSRKVELILQLPADKIDTKVPLIKLGIDSLVAVELRSWFLKELAIDMAVLKFLGGSSILDICKDALGQLSSLSSAAAAAAAAADTKATEAKEAKDVKEAKEVKAEVKPTEVAATEATTEATSKEDTSEASTTEATTTNVAATEVAATEATKEATAEAAPALAAPAEVIAVQETPKSPVLAAMEATTEATITEAIPKETIVEATVEAIEPTEPTEPTPTEVTATLKAPAEVTAAQEAPKSPAMTATEAITGAITEPTTTELAAEPTMEPTTTKPTATLAALAEVQEAPKSPVLPATEATAEAATTDVATEATTEVTTGTTTETTIEATTEATTEAATEATTEAATEATTEVPTAEATKEATTTEVTTIEAALDVIHTIPKSPELTAADLAMPSTPSASSLSSNSPTGTPGSDFSDVMSP